MRFDPALHGRGLVSGVVVNNEMEIEAGRGLLVHQFLRRLELTAVPDPPTVLSRNRGISEEPQHFA
jgi:hypothetical protein